MDAGSYDTAQMCMNGHTINPDAASNPRHNAKFCKQCGGETTIACAHCKASIRGKYSAPGYLDATKYNPPKFCHECGKPYSWTERALITAHELAQEVDGFDENDRAALSRSLNDLVRETPATPVAAVRFKKLMKKAGIVAADGFRTILVDVLSEAVKKQLWP
jgi:hypothetical protein